MTQEVLNTTPSLAETQPTVHDPELLKPVEAGDIADFAAYNAAQQRELAGKTEDSSKAERHMQRAQEFDDINSIISGMESRGNTLEDIEANLVDASQEADLDPADPVDKRMLDNRSRALQFISDNQNKTKSNIVTQPDFAEKVEDDSWHTARTHRAEREAHQQEIGMITDAEQQNILESSTAEQTQAAIEEADRLSLEQLQNNPTNNTGVDDAEFAKHQFAGALNRARASELAFDAGKKIDGNHAEEYQALIEEAKLWERAAMGEGIYPEEVEFIRGRARDLQRAAAEQFQPSSHQHRAEKPDANAELTSREQANLDRLKQNIADEQADVDDKLAQGSGSARVLGPAREAFFAVHGSEKALAERLSSLFEAVNEVEKNRHAQGLDKNDFAPRDEAINEVYKTLSSDELQALENAADYELQRQQETGIKIQARMRPDRSFRALMGDWR